MIWLLTLPFRLAFALLFGIVLLPFLLLALPFLLLRAVFRTAVFVLLLPIVALVSLIALFAVGLALALPLLPLAAIGLIVWAVVKMASRPRLTA